MNGDAATSLIARLRAVVGDRWTVVQEHELRTYESDGLLQYQRAARGRGAARRRRPGPRVVAACAEAGVPWVAARRRLRAVRRRAAGRRRRADRAVPAHPHPRDRPRQRPGLRRAGRHQRGRLRRGRARLLLPARPVQPDRLHDRRQRGGELRRRALLQVRVHHQLRDRASRSCCPTARSCSSAATELDPPGYDLLGAFVGSEGTLGIATKIWLRVVPVPEATRTLVAFFDSTRAAGTAVSAIVQAGIVPGAIEMMDATTIVAAEQMAHAGYPVGRGAALLVELDGAAAECTAQFEQVDRDLPGERLRRRAGQPRRGRARSCSGRPARPRSRRWAASRPTTSCRTASSRAPRCPTCSPRIEALATAYGLTVANVFHAGDGNLHPLVCYDGRGRRGRRPGPRSWPGRSSTSASTPAARSPASTASASTSASTWRRCSARPTWPRSSALRCAFDPAGLANPGKVMPTPRLCGEVPGPVPPAPAGGRRPGGAVLMERAAHRRRRRGPAAPPGRRGPLDPAGRRRQPGRLGRRRRPGHGCRSRPPGWTGSSRTTRATSRPCWRPACRWPTRSAALAAAGQWLALDPPDLGGTIGGLVATADSGPARHRYGGVRDLVIGITVALVRRHGRPLRGHGHQERRRVRPRQAVHRLVRHARPGHRGGGAAAPAAGPHRDGRRRDRRRRAARRRSRCRWPADRWRR